MNKIAIIGDGGWGTALSILISRKNFQVFLYSPFADYAEFLRESRENAKFLPGVKIPAEIEITSDLSLALTGAKLAILAVPSQYMRASLGRIKKNDFAGMKFLSVAKGLEENSAKRMSEVIYEELGRVDLAVLSGPNIAAEVALGIPSASVCASKNKKLAGMVQDVLMSDGFRVYTSNDLAGVELGGAFKNIIAIACGISDGLGFGTNTKAALLCRGLIEITRMGTILGGAQKTFYGLSGMGDLVTTCMSLQSRNRWLGEELGRGKRLATVLASTKMVVEGVSTAKTALKLARKNQLAMPITEQVCNVLFRDKAPLEALRALMLRSKKEEGIK